MTLNTSPFGKPMERVGGWAPGEYLNTCMDCGNQFGGDKRSIQCLTCAVDSLRAPPPEAGPVAPGHTDLMITPEAITTALDADDAQRRVICDFMGWPEDGPAWDDAGKLVCALAPLFAPTNQSGDLAGVTGAVDPRVAAFFAKLEIGTGDDPIGFLLASHAYMAHERNEALRSPPPIPPELAELSGRAIPGPLELIGDDICAWSRTGMEQEVVAEPLGNTPEEASANADFLVACWNHVRQALSAPVAETGGGE